MSLVFKLKKKRKNINFHIDTKLKIISRNNFPQLPPTARYIKSEIHQNNADELRAHAFRLQPLADPRRVCRG